MIDFQSKVVIDIAGLVVGICWLFDGVHLIEWSFLLLRVFIIETLQGGFLFELLKTLRRGLFLGFEGF